MKKLKKILSFLAPYKLYTALGVLFNILTAIFGAVSFMMMIPFLQVLFGLKEVVSTQEPPFHLDIKSLEDWFNWFVQDSINSHSKLYGLILISAFIVVLSFLKNINRYATTYVMAPLRTKIIRDIRNQLYKKILKLPISFFSEEKRGDIISKMTSDVQEIEVSIMRSIDMLFKDPILLAVYITLLFWMSWQLTAFVFVLLPLTGGIIGTIGKNLRKTGFRGQKRLGTLMTILDETLSGFRVVKAFNAEEKQRLVPLQPCRSRRTSACCIKVSQTTVVTASE